MTSLTKEPYKGCRDFFPKDKRKLNSIFKKMAEAAESFGFEPYDGPILESVDLYLAKSGEELINDQIYRFTDRGDRDVAIRPEMTPTLARMIAQIHRETPKPLRWYAIPNLMRYEKPQRGRLREHWQFNADIFGAPAGKGEVEILLLLIHFLESFGANHTHASLLLNDRRIVDGFFTKHLKLDAETKHKVYKILDRAKKISAEALNEQLSTQLKNPTLVQDTLTYLKLSSFEDLQTFLLKHDLVEEGRELQEVVSQLSANGHKNYLTFDPTIVRGLDYYTGLVFEVFDKHPENRRAICGGGAYANLLQIFNEPSLPGIGFGMGDVTLTDFLETHQLIAKEIFPDIDILCTYQVASAENTAWKISTELRKKNIKVEMMHGEQKSKKIFQLAEYKKHRFVIFIGENEINTNSLQLKNLNTKEAHQVPNDQNVIQQIIKIIS